MKLIVSLISFGWALTLAVADPGHPEIAEDSRTSTHDVMNKTVRYDVLPHGGEIILRAASNR